METATATLEGFDCPSFKVETQNIVIPPRSLDSDVRSPSFSKPRTPTFMDSSNSSLKAARDGDPVRRPSGSSSVQGQDGFFSLRTAESLVADYDTSRSITPIPNRSSFALDTTDYFSQSRFGSESGVEYYKSELDNDFNDRGNPSGGFYLSNGIDPDYLHSHVSETPFEYGHSSMELNVPFTSYSVNLRSSRGYSLYPPDNSLSVPPSEQLHPDSFLFDASAQSPSYSRPVPPPPHLPKQDRAISPLAKKASPPPLPPRSYLSSGNREAYSAADFYGGAMSFMNSNRSSTSSLSSPHFADRRASLPGLWTHQMPLSAAEETWEGAGSLLAASAMPFMATGGANGAVETKETKETGRGEKKKGAGEDVDLAKLRSGEETRSAVMIRNIPNRFSPEELSEILDLFVKGKYSIINMPLDSKTHRNLGYSFIQFNSIDDLITAYENLQGKTWPRSESKKQCRFCYAKIQGDPNAVNADANGASGKDAPKKRVAEEGK